MILDAAIVAGDPSLIPYAMPDDMHIAFHRVTLSTLRTASFLDGREPVGKPVGICSVLDLRAALDAMPSSEPFRSIFHVSFCGSTLLSRMLDVPGRTVVYREPAIQIALADRLTAGQSIPDVLTVATCLLARSVAGAAAVVKPTNWANVLLPAWIEVGTVAPLFITMRPLPFLTAVFRGGRERIAFTIRAAEHFAKMFEDGQERIAAAVKADSNPLNQAARLTLVALDLQLRLFASAKVQLQFGRDCTIDYADIRTDPKVAAAFAAEVLGIDMPDFSARAELPGHAKDPRHAFSQPAEDQANNTILNQYGATFDAALGWATTAGYRYDRECY